MKASDRFDELMAELDEQQARIAERLAQQARVRWAADEWARRRRARPATVLPAGHVAVILLLHERTVLALGPAEAGRRMCPEDPVSRSVVERLVRDGHLARVPHMTRICIPVVDLQRFVESGMSDGHGHRPQVHGGPADR